MAYKYQSHPIAGLECLVEGPYKFVLPLPGFPFADTDELGGVAKQVGKRLDVRMEHGCVDPFRHNAAWYPWQFLLDHTTSPLRWNNRQILAAQLQCMMRAKFSGRIGNPGYSRSTPHVKAAHRERQDINTR
ncbi:hypothetical protein CCAX7_62390 [Capsulimonas corticalis]|uniref:Uncharacterized protein n=1 Tax=Capsulimonas corticalis TaxID=2219043 RepID=A0A402CWM5_9BACT|nr:hypothetical protein CCAX7_62390 [Capsulimonas corticalis]